jgi:nucleoside phosphorylase
MTSKIDVLIVTALLEERTAAQEVLSAGVDGMRVAAWSEVGDEPYLVGELAGEGGATLHIALGRPTRMGPTSTASFTAMLAERLKPRCLAMTGVCAGNPSRVALGDVIVAELTYAHDEGKRTKNGFEGDHRQWSAPDNWIREAQELQSTGLPSQGEATSVDAELWLLERLYHGADPRQHPARDRYFPDGTWKQAVLELERKGMVTRERNSLVISDTGRDEVDKALVYELDPPRVLPFKVLTGPMASGAVVVKDGVTWDALEAMGVRTVIGLEMEGAAIGYVARSKDIPNWIVVKGVMDHADPNKDDRYKPFAARASAEVLVRLLRKMMPAPDPAGDGPSNRARGRGASSGQEAGSPDFVIDPTPENLPAGLRRGPGHAVVHREPLLDGLFALYRNPAPGQLALIKGPPRAGKSDAISLFASALANSSSAEPRIGLLHVELDLTTRPQRAVFRAVSGASELAERIGMLPVGGEDDEDATVDHEVEYLQDILRARLDGRRLVTLVETYSDIAGRPGDRADLEQLLSLAPFRRGFSVVEAGLATLKPAHLVCVDLDQTALSPEHATDFLGQCFGLGSIAGEAIQHVAELGGAEALLPGIIHDGALVHVSRAAVAAAKPDAATLALTILTRAQEVAEAVVGKLVTESGKGADESRDALLALMAMAVFDGIPIGAVQRDALALADIPTRGLVRIGWLDQLADGDQLTGFGRDALRAAARLTLRGPKGPLEIGAHELLSVLDRLASGLLNERDDVRSETLERAVGWLGHILPEDNVLLLRLKAQLNLESVFDPVPPFSADEDRALASRFQALAAEGDLDFAVAALAGHAREASRSVRRGREALYEDYRAGLDTVATLIEGGAVLNFRRFFALDSAVYIGARKLYAFGEAHRFYQRILTVLAGQESQAFEQRNGAWLAAWASLLLNAADLGVSHNAADAARDMVARASEIIDQDDVFIDTIRKQWLRSRVALLRERLARNAEERQAALAEATECAALAFAHLPDSPRGRQYYLRTVRRQVDAESDETRRKAHVDAARRTIEALHGLPEHWNVSTRAQFAALMRREARRSWNASYQKIRARDALALLRGARHSGDEQVLLNPEACLVLARLQAFLGQTEAALHSVEASLAQAPSPAALHLKFRLFDGQPGGAEDWSSGTTVEGLMPDRLRKAIAAYRRRDRSGEWPSPALANLELWTWQRQWREEGSLERWASRMQDAEPAAAPYSRLPRHEKAKLIDRIYAERKRILDGIEKAFPPFIKLVEARFELEYQYVRSTAVLDRKPPEVASAFGILDTALNGNWRGSHLLQLKKAEYHRYLWDTDQAVEGLRRVKEAAVNGDLRRQAAVALVRTQHQQAVYARDLTPEVRGEALAEARRGCEELQGAFFHAQDIALLGDQVALELGEPVDWTALEEVYAKVIGCDEGFPTTLIANHASLGSDENEAPRDTAAVLQRNFADPQILGSAGMLYLRRGEKDTSNNRAADFEHAVFLFLAKALIERSWEGKERPVTVFQIARAIISAAQAFESVNPIAGLSPQGKPDQISLAKSLLQSAVDRTTGHFQEVARAWRRDADEIIKKWGAKTE